MKNVIAFLVKWLLIFAVASVMIFGVVRLMPSTPVEQWLTSFNLPHTKENVAKVTALMGLDQPLPVQYFAWLRNFFKGDWGLSLISHVSIRDTFIQKLPYSVSIGLSGILISAVLAFFLGYRAALHIGGVCDRLSAALAVFSQSIPSFITSVFIIYFLGVKLKAVKFFTGSVRNAMISAILITAIYQLGRAVQSGAQRLPGGDAQELRPLCHLQGFFQGTCAVSPRLKAGAVHVNRRGDRQLCLGFWWQHGAGIRLHYPRCQLFFSGQHAVQ